MIRRWIIAVELSLLRDHLIHDEGGQLFSNGVQIIIVEGGLSALRTPALEEQSQQLAEIK